MAGPVAPAADCPANVSQRKAPGAISAIAFIVNPVKPKVCFISLAFSAIGILLCSRVRNKITLRYCLREAGLIPTTAKPSPRAPPVLRTAALHLDRANRVATRQIQQSIRRFARVEATSSHVVLLSLKGIHFLMGGGEGADTRG